MAGARRLTETTIAGLGWTSLAMGLQAVLQIIALVFLARLLTPQEFGLFAAALVIGGFSAIFSELGVSPAIVQRKVLESRHVRSGFTLSVALSLAVALAVFLCADTIAAFFQIPALADVVRVMVFGFPLQGISTVAQSMAMRNFRFRWLALVDASAFALGFVVVAPVLTVLGYGVYALVGAYLTQHGVRTLILLSGQSHEKKPMLQMQAVKELLYFGAGFTLAKLGNYLATQADNLVVGRWLGPTALGLYSNAYQLMASPATLMGQVLDRVLFPTMASVQHEPDRLIRAYRSGVFVCAAIMLPVSVVIAILAPEIVLVLLGPSWIEVTIPLRILAFGMLFRTSYKISDTIVRATGAVYARAWRQAIFAVAVFLGALGGQHWGLGGVAVGVFLALALNFAQMAQLSLRLTGMRWKDFGQAHLSGLVLAVILGLASLATATWLRHIEAGTVAVVAGVTVVCVVLLPMLVLARPQLFLGPDRVNLLRALAKVAPMRMRSGVALLQRRGSA
ncbi:MAG: lipopolysaccharide biosynthesis protein [Paracoccaceae bacterium]|nr:lipopolysaccharide biosynthesis protein [Paracoccaceae bacterium]